MVRVWECRVRAGLYSYRLFGNFGKGAGLWVLVRVLRSVRSSLRVGRAGLK
nr:MAG TPA: hypothetical protein [Caudoviricetes sp.]